MAMDQDAITRYLSESFNGLDVIVAEAGTFFIYDPERNLPANRRLPFATIVSRDDPYDCISQLDRPGVFRLNVGVGKDTYRALFGEYQPPADAGSAGDSAHDFAALNRLLPHPVYGRMFWLSVLNPSDETFEMLRPLLAKAYERAVRRRTPRLAATWPESEYEDD
jgi:hypothetical protein